MSDVKAKQETTALANEAYPLWLSNFISIYGQLSTDNLDLLSDIYHPDVVFKDPMHHLHGFKQLFDYFEGLYTNLLSCDFNIKQVIFDGDIAGIYWHMSFQHPRLNHGQPIDVEGHSKIIGRQDKVIFHQDYIDLGAMLYEHLPVIGRLIKWFKSRAVQ